MFAARSIRTADKPASHPKPAARSGALLHRRTGLIAHIAGLHPAARGGAMALTPVA